MLSKLFRRVGDHPRAASSASVEAPAIDRRFGIAFPSAAGLGDVLSQVQTQNNAGEFGKSLRLVENALGKRADDTGLMFARATTLFAWGRYWESLWSYDELRSRDVSHSLLFLQLARVHLALGHVTESDEYIRKALEVDPESIPVRSALMEVLIKQDKHKEALGEWLRLFGADDRDPQRLTWVVFCKVETGDLIGAETDARRVLAIDPNQPGVWNNLGVSLHGQGRREEALDAFIRAQAVDDRLGSGHDAFANVAKQYALMGQLDSCIQVFEAELPSRPNPQGHIIYSEALLKVGRIPEGAEQYEFRWLKPPLLYRRHGSSKPAWNGQDLRDKTLLVRVEQGIGDTIQFVRYLPLVKQLGARVLVRRIAGITTTASGIDRLVEQDELFEYDYYVNLLSLPRIFGTDLRSIPCDSPYLRSDPELRSQWSETIGNGETPRVGVVWAGNPAHARDRERSIPLRSMVPLFDQEGIRFFSLQKGARERGDDDILNSRGVVDLGSAFEDFADTAAAIDGLDLIICVDTAVAHLAGALGKSVWLLLQKDGEWRWLGDDRDSSPWYPTMRIYRQSQFGEWNEVIQRVGADLRAISGSGRTLLAPSIAKTTMHSEPAKRVPKHRPHGGTSTRGMSAVTEGRAGIFQYLPHDPVVGASIDWYGELLQPELDLIGNLIRPGSTVVEVAPGIGAHTLGLAARLAPKGHLMAFEPRPLMHRLLTQNLAINHIHNVTVLKRALWTAPAVGHNLAEPDPELPAAPPMTTAMRTDNLDDYMLRQLHLLKITDAFCALPVLAGATETMWRVRPCLFVAASDDEKVRSIASLVKEMGYRCWYKATPLFNPGNFNRRPEDIFPGRCALAVVAIPEELDVDVHLGDCVEI